MSTHNLCFGAKIRKIGIPLHTQFYYIKVGFKGIFIARICFPDDWAVSLDGLSRTDQSMVPHDVLQNR